ncbi:MAG: hypothetical protein WAL32_05555 [Terriglobales bacterium]
MHRIAAVSLAFFLLGSLGFAQVPTAGNVFLGYSYMSADLPGSRANLNGWNASLEGKVLPLLGIVADFSGNYGSQNLPLFTACPGGALGASCSVHEENFLFGPRLSISVGKFRPFIHGLIGASHINEGVAGFFDSDTSFADALGGGLDYHLIPRISWRVQVDALQTRFFAATQENVRVSTGVAFRF